MAASGAADADVQTAIYKKLYPVDFLRRHLEEQVREDGRALDEFRPVSLATGILTQANGSALVRFGTGTMVTAAVQAHITEPHHDRPHEGFVVPSIDLSPLCSPQYRAGPPGDEAQALAHYLQRFLDESRALPRESLCIEPGVAVWCVYVDLVVVSEDGNVLDAAALAAVAALADARLPRVLRCDDASACVCTRERTENLELAYLPVLATFGLVDATYLLADVTAFEGSLTAAARRTSASRTRTTPTPTSSSCGTRATRSLRARSCTTTRCSSAASTPRRPARACCASCCTNR
ncbi:hypothetical protein CBS14141_003887 [Malassezia furfur]|nr:hypothetical protein CBS14141_003887 [Malassezia furfur]